MIKRTAWIPILLLLSACAPQPSPRLVDVTLYGRNAAPVVAWFAVQPLTQPISSVGFGPDPGYACWEASEGSSIVLLDRSPSELDPANVVRAVVVIPAASETAILWVDVAADGRAASGSGVPEWWPENGGGC